MGMTSSASGAWSSKGGLITAVGEPIPANATVVDGNGATLLPGLIDSHVHTDVEGLRDALAFGVTTELEMQGHWSLKKRQQVADRDDIADLRTSGMGVMRKGGHPSEYITSSGNLLIRYLYRFFPSVQSPDQAKRFVAKQVASGADYIKVFIEDGSTIGSPACPWSSSRSCSRRSTPPTSTASSRSPTCPRPTGRAVRSPVG